MMPPCNQSLHHTEFTSRTEREYPDRPLPSRTTSSPRAPGRVSLAHPRTLILLRQWPPPDTTPDAAWLLSPPLLPSRTVLCREAKRPRTPGRVSLTRTTSLTQTRTLGPSRGLAVRDNPHGSHRPNNGFGPPALADHMWLLPPGFSRPPYNHHTGDFGMNCTHGAHTMVCKTTLRSHVCSSTGGRSHCLSCALDAHMFVLRRTSKHNQPPHMGLSSAAPCQAAWPFSVTLRLSSVHQKATSWARRRCAQETIPPPSASYTHERTSNPLFRRFLETPSRPVLSTAVTAPTGIRPRHKIFGQSTISPTTQKPHQTKTETGYGARPTVQHTRI